MIYEYTCGNCGADIEIEHSMKDKAKRKCPKCGKMKLKRLVSGGSGFSLTGDGWAGDGYSGGKKSSKDRARFNEVTGKK